MSVLAFIAAAATVLPIESATLPLPAALRASAIIVALDKSGSVTTLREGTGKMVCLADRPGDEEFDVRCYHRDFVPYLYRSRQLIAQGVSRQDLNSRLEQELKEGKLRIAMTPTAGYRMLGPISAITDNGTGWSDKMKRWQSIHIPRALAEDLGLITDYDGPMPYVMSSGDLWSHVMINSPPD